MNSDQNKDFFDHAPTWKIPNDFQSKGSNRDEQNVNQQ